MLPARRTSSQRIEATLEQRKDDSLIHGVPTGTSPHVNSCLSPIGQFSIPEPFNDFAGSIPTVGSPHQQARSSEYDIGCNRQDAESEPSSDHMSWAFVLSLGLLVLKCHIAMPGRPVQSEYLLR